MNPAHLSHRHPSATTTVITVTGDVDAALAQNLEAYIRQVRRRPGDQLVFDLSKACFRSRVGLQVLVEAAVFAHGHGGEVLLSAPPAGIIALMDVAKLDALVPVYATVEDAVHAALTSTP